MTPTALITGATSGIGAEFARQLANRGYNLVLTARNEERLKDSAELLAREYAVQTEYIAADLADPEGVERVSRRLERPDISMLVNNAGYGLKNGFERNELSVELDHLNVLVAAPLALSHTALNTMLSRMEEPRGHIINVASVAGFIPRGTYSAAKSWVITFSRWANLHYGGRGVHVTALCPGFVHTEFHQRMDMDKSIYPGWMWLDAERVVREGLADAFAGKGVSIPSKRYKALAWVGARGPKALVARIAGRGR
ncbi:SDR family NAD(P)-dependent oxidoreductase [Arthrobacter sp. zg-Y820]|uniref:SDR family NAD(P)-dependent oxidoreductase n=1 Tax=unclassified Arthrobacter TaxID=235627 RepID=UPI001E323802|nr:MULTISPECIES: SDR family NAD(P)-dependent oxidoreductase [unclassified Arthrobacter]MCC9197101.1 SDR family NAD(P)-dependent oxidoreductase [Arthrobacter sp. zg-Y820]MDK1279966.1 SDR family NAD(P)-dependent oxidoreductase [Arthrobacter sp. zg.Y820]WIB09265.1 SDR family NAD(P)-dependent oxidoreductase [Arthrobacter sp. zg-Y820]